MNNYKTQRDTEELMEEVYFKDQNVKSRLFGLETSNDNMRELIEYNAEQLKEMKSDARWWRKTLITCVIANIGLLIAITIKLLLD